MLKKLKQIFNPRKNLKAQGCIKKTNPQEQIPLSPKLSASLRIESACTQIKSLLDARSILYKCGVTKMTKQKYAEVIHGIEELIAIEGMRLDDNIQILKSTDDDLVSKVIEGIDCHG